MMQRTAHDVVVDQTKADIGVYVAQIAEDRNLTEIELLQILAGIQFSYLGYMRRDERDLKEQAEADE